MKYLYSIWISLINQWSLLKAIGLCTPMASWRSLSCASSPFISPFSHLFLCQRSSTSSQLGLVNIFFLDILSFRAQQFCFLAGSQIPPGSATSTNSTKMFYLGFFLPKYRSSHCGMLSAANMPSWKIFAFPKTLFCCQICVLLLQSNWYKLCRHSIPVNCTYEKFY